MSNSESEEDTECFIARINEEIQTGAVIEGKKKAKQLRKELSQKRRSDRAVAESREQSLSTLEEIWERLCSQYGSSSISVDVEVFLDVFRKCQECGLGSKLVTSLDAKNAEILRSDGLLIDLKQNDVAFLCVLAIEEKESHDWCERLLKARTQQKFMKLEIKDVLQHHIGDCLRLQQFRRLMPILAKVMQLEVAFILSAFVWVLSKRFEMPQTLYERFFEKNGNIRFLGQGHGNIHERLFHNEEPQQVSFGSFTRNDFMRLCYAAELVDSKAKSGKPWEYWSTFWDALMRQIDKHVNSYVDRRPGIRLFEKVPKTLSKHDVHGNAACQLHGRTELTVFLELLFRHMPDKRFKSPLDLCNSYLCNNAIDPVEALAQLRVACTVFDKVDEANSVLSEIHKVSQSNLSREKSLELFEQRDRDGSGSLELEELTKLLKSINSVLTESQIKSLFQMADKSGDGSVDFNEFFALISSEQSPEDSAKGTPMRGQHEGSAKGSTSKPSKPEELKARFHDNDTNSDGLLDYEELHLLLKAGDPTLTDAEINTLFKLADVSGDGVIDFDEFVDFIFSESSGKTKKAPAKSVCCSSASGKEDSAGADWKSMKRVFSVVAGRDEQLDSLEFSKLLKKANLCNKGFQSGDADTIFTKVCPKGHKKLKFKEFKQGVLQVATKKGWSVSEVISAIAQSHES